MVRGFKEIFEPAIETGGFFAPPARPEAIHEKVDPCGGGERFEDPPEKQPTHVPKIAL